MIGKLYGCPTCRNYTHTYDYGNVKHCIRCHTKTGINFTEREKKIMGSMMIIMQAMYDPDLSFNKYIIGRLNLQEESALATSVGEFITELKNEYSAHTKKQYKGIGGFISGDVEKCDVNPYE